MKTRLLWVGLQKHYLNIRIDGKKLNQNDDFVYLGGAVCTTARRRKFSREYTGASAWKKVGGVMGYRHRIGALFMRNTSLLTRRRHRDDNEKTKRETAICLRKIPRVKIIYRRRIEKMRKEVGVRESFTRKLDWRRGKNGRGSVNEDSGHV